MRRINVTKKVVILKCYCYRSLQNEEYCAFDFMYKITAFFKDISLESLRQNCQAFLLNFSLGQKPCFRTFKAHCL